VNELVDDIKHLPTRLIQVSINMEGFVKELHTFNGNTAIEDIKSIVKEMHDLIFSVQRDLLKFYNVSTSSKLIVKHHFTHGLELSYSLSQCKRYLSLFRRVEVADVMS